ncbi:hypothetical protein Dsin_029474 [Dipteronia sinensis]|uniref:PGG domain-containing protein n=1 Tax=Dipteronia sinensis TaxID=43782 RepID=A0AAD9ZSE7_9ROSI|nr:hypothetical protein Dsin_029474 [Dipteronia sinensis]
MMDFSIRIGNDQQRDDDDQNHQHQNPTQIEHQPELVLLNRIDDRNQHNRKQYQDIAVKLQRAALKGNKKEVVKILKEGADLRWAITRGHETVLHVATGAKQTALVKMIIGRMKPNDLMLKDRNGNTAFCFAAAVGATKIAEMMLKENRDLATFRGSQNKTPLYMAVFFGRRKMAEKLIKLYNDENSHNNLTKDDKTDLFFKSIDTGLYDFALKLLKKNSYLAVARTRSGGETALHVLARQPSAFHGKSVHNLILGVLNFNGNPAIELVQCLWQNITLWPEGNIISDIIRTPSELLFDATKSGNFGFLTEIIKVYPDVIHEKDKDGRSIFHVAVLHRHSDIFGLIYQTIYLNKELLLSFVDSSHNNILHLAAKCQNLPLVSSEKGAALKMLRELLFFKEIEKIVPPHFKDKVGEQQLTPQELFSKEHEDLLKGGEAWMKNAATSCLVVATIITSVIFTATYTVPGGTTAHGDIDDHNSTVAEGSPIHLNKTLFKIFSMSNVIGLSFSTISILMFLSILLSGFAEKDFIWFLPLKLFVGLVTLLFSVISIMVTYSSTYFLAYPYHERLNWITSTTVLLVSVPIIICAQVLFPLLGDILLLLCRGIDICFLKPVLEKVHDLLEMVHDLLEMVHDFVVYI